MLTAILVVDEIDVTQRAESPILHIAAEQRRKWLSVYRVQSSGRNPPGLNITRGNICSGSNSILATLELKFPNTQGTPSS